MVTTIAGGAGRGLVDGRKSEAKFSWPYGVAAAPNGRMLYVADSGNHCVRQVDVATGIVTTLAGDGTAGFRDGPADTGTSPAPACPALHQLTPQGSTDYLLLEPTTGARVRGVGGRQRGCTGHEDSPRPQTASICLWQTTPTAWCGGCGWAKAAEAVPRTATLTTASVALWPRYRRRRTEAGSRTL